VHEIESAANHSDASDEIDTQLLCPILLVVTSTDCRLQPLIQGTLVAFLAGHENLAVDLKQDGSPLIGRMAVAIFIPRSKSFLSA
jgi:hypothetical protein